MVGGWVRSGAAQLCGRADGPPLNAPVGLERRLDEFAARLGASTAKLGRGVDVDPFALLTERAALNGNRRRGAVSCGGASRLLPAADGWVAVTLARESDLELLPAWVGIAAAGADEAFERLAEAITVRPSAEVVGSATELGLPVSAVGEVAAGPAVRPLPVGRATPISSLEEVVVVDLSGLWAGPLCSRLLADAGATVVKVESTSRPDGARRGDRRFFDLLNAGKRSVALDLDSAAGQLALAALLRRADVVIEGSRPRALRAFGIDAEELARVGPRVWVSLTAYGRDPRNEWRVGFGDDAAAGGGLVVYDEDGPVFAGDAIADPLTGLTAAVAVLDALQGDERVVLDVALARSAAAASVVTAAAPVAGPGPLRVPDVRGPAAELGADTAEVLDWLG